MSNYLDKLRRGSGLDSYGNAYQFPYEVKAVAEIERLQARVDVLEGAIHDLKDYWYADPDQSTWGGAIPRLFEALAATEQGESDVHM